MGIGDEHIIGLVLVKLVLWEDVLAPGCGEDVNEDNVLLDEDDDADGDCDNEDNQCHEQEGVEQSLLSAEVINGQVGW